MELMIQIAEYVFLGLGVVLSSVAVFVALDQGESEEIFLAGISSVLIAIGIKYILG